GLGLGNVMRPFALLAFRRLTARRGAVLVVVAAVAFGVAATLAARLLYASVLRSHADVVERFAGRAALQVTNGTSGVAEEIVDAVRAVRGVGAVAPSVEGWLPMDDGAHDGERLYFYGIDLLEDQQVRDYGSGDAAVVEDPLVFLAAPDSVALTADFARARGI